MDASFHAQLTKVFIQDTYDSLLDLSNRFALLDSVSENVYQESLLDLYRDIHGIKGAAACVEWERTNRICHLLESKFHTICEHSIKLDEEQIVFFNQIFRYLVDCFQKAHNSTDDHPLEEEYISDPKYTCLLDLLENYGNSGASSFPGTLQENCKVEKREEAGKYLISSEKAIEQSQNTDSYKEGLSSTSNSSSFLADLTDGSTITFAEKTTISFEKLDKLLLCVEKLSLFQSGFDDYLSTLETMKQRVLEFKDPILQEIQDVLHGFSSLKQELSEKQRLASQLHKSIEKTMEEVLMLPLSLFLQGFSSWTKSLAERLGKKVKLSIAETNIQVDKRVLDTIKEPLLHLLRNALDHGLESPTARIRLGKDACGEITIVCEQTEQHRLKITVADDGKGLDLDSIRKTALEKGLYERQEIDKLSTEELKQLIFTPHFSTSNVITDISGRGVGMHAVKAAVQRLQGNLQLSSVAQQGTCFNIEVPLSVTAIKGTVVGTEKASALILFQHTQKVIEISPSEVIRNKNLLSFKYEGMNVPLLPLHNIFGETFDVDKKERIIIVVVSINDKLLGIAVSKLLSQTEVYMKKLTPQLEKTPFVFGYAVLGSQKVIPILNCKELVLNKRYELIDEEIEVLTHSEIPQEKKQKTSTKTILVVEDNLTPRMVLISLLQSAGYKTLSAVDGLEGLSILQSEKNIDMVITDIEMPNMNGFELIEKIRSKHRKPNIPIIIVSTLESSEYKKKGLDYGANAFVVKGKFEEESLLNIVRNWV